MLCMTHNRQKVLSVLFKNLYLQSYFITQNVLVVALDSMEHPMLCTALGVLATSHTYEFRSPSGHKQLKVSYSTVHNTEMEVDPIC